MRISTTRDKRYFVQLELSALDDKLIDKEMQIDVPTKSAKLIFNKDNYNFEILYKRLLSFYRTAKFSTLIDLRSFIVKPSLPDLNEVVKCVANAFHAATDEIFTMKKKEKKPKLNHGFFIKGPHNKRILSRTNAIIEAITYARNLQIMPPNICTSEYMADKIVNDINQMGIENLTAKYLNKQEIEELGMNLLLGVNKGSQYEPRLVVIDYTPKLEKIHVKKVYVGKGITFDTGGYNIKIRDYMLGMKYDMSGAAIAAASVIAIAKVKGRKNVSAVLAITDNRLANDAITPDMVLRSMSGKSVEIENTDAEGRLVLADAITYASKVAKASTIVSIATLTGAIVRTLGTTYSGIWSTSEQRWNRFERAAKAEHELVWRMPLHEDFNKGNLETDIADIKNCSEKTLSDSNDAAMFLSQFRENSDFVHCDIAGTADVNRKPTGVLIRTLTRFGLNN